MRITTHTSDRVEVDDQARAPHPPLIGTLMDHPGYFELCFAIPGRRPLGELYELERLLRARRLAS